MPGARNHDLVLHARVAGYQREWCERWLYGPDRRLIELYNKSLNMVPMHELPHYRVTWHRNLAAIDNGILKDQATVAKAILKRLKADGPQSTAAFSEHSHAVDWWWAPTRASRAVMEALFVTGRIGISRREGNRRYYDLMERLVPAELLKLRESEEDGMTRRLLSRFRATGMTTPVGTQAEVMYSAGSTAERVARTARLVADGELLPIEVEGLKGARYIIAAEGANPRGHRRRGSLPTPGVSFLAPLDPLVWDRRMLRALWDFDYLWEVYVPEAKRKWGYYVLPILFGDRFVGRIEPRLDRKAKTLSILGVWFQAGFRRSRRRASSPPCATRSRPIGPSSERRRSPGHVPVPGVRSPARCDVRQPPDVRTDRSGVREVDDERGVVGGDAGVGRRLAGVAVALGGDGPRGERRRQVDVVDPHPEVLVEVAGAVVPPGEEARLGVELPHDVDHPPCPQLRDGRPLARRDVGRAVHRGDVPDVDVLGRHVVVAADRELGGRVVVVQPDR